MLDPAPPKAKPACSTSRLLELCMTYPPHGSDFELRLVGERPATTTVATPPLHTLSECNYCAWTFLVGPRFLFPSVVASVLRTA